MAALPGTILIKSCRFFITFEEILRIGFTSALNQRISMSARQLKLSTVGWSTYFSPNYPLKNKKRCVGGALNPLIGEK